MSDFLKELRETNSFSDFRYIYIQFCCIRENVGVKTNLHEECKIMYDEKLVFVNH